MQKRKFGNSGFEIAPLAFGGNVFGWTADEATSFRLLDALVDAGFDFIDTADVYSAWVPGHQGGESETILGKWLKLNPAKRQKVIVATKVGLQMPAGKGLSPAYIRQAVEASLKRLQSDCIDLYQAHRADPDTPIQETLSAFAELMKQGKVRAIGASNYDGAQLSEALDVSRRHGLPRYETLQPHYNLAHRAEYESELEAICLKEGLGVIPYYSLAGGFLTGKYRAQSDLDTTRGKGAAGRSFNEHGLKVLAAVDTVAAQYKVKPVHVALAWLIARPSVTAPIASATSIEQLDALIAATRLQLDSGAIELLNQASAE